MTNLIYFHVATIGNYQEIFDEIYYQIEKSNLIENIDLLNVCIVGNGSLNVSSNTKINVYRTDEVSTGEFYTLDKIKLFSDSSSTNNKILYLHTKGVTTPNNVCIDEWREYMTYFNVCKYDKCLEYLNEYDACGVDLVDTPQIHFSGNFWWSNSEYIKTLPTIHDLKYKIKPVLSVRHNCEFWIGMGGGRLKSLWDSNINVYERHLHRYSNSEYIKCL
jgi:hypothetical protein